MVTIPLAIAGRTPQTSMHGSTLQRSNRAVPRIRPYTSSGGMDTSCSATGPAGRTVDD